MREYDITKNLLAEAPCWSAFSPDDLTHIQALAFVCSNLLLKLSRWKAKAALLAFGLFWYPYAEENGIKPVDKKDPYKRISYLTCKKCPYFIKAGEMYFCWDKIGGTIYPCQWMYFCPKEYWGKEIEPTTRKVCKDDKVIYLNNYRREKGDKN